MSKRRSNSNQRLMSAVFVLMAVLLICTLLLGTCQPAGTPTGI